MLHIWLPFIQDRIIGGRLLSVFCMAILSECEVRDESVPAASPQPRLRELVEAMDIAAFRSKSFHRLIEGVPDHAKRALNRFAGHRTKDARIVSDQPCLPQPKICIRPATADIAGARQLPQQPGVLHAIAGVPDSRCVATAAAPRSAAANMSKERSRFIGFLHSAIGAVARRRRCARQQVRCDRRPAQERGSQYEQEYNASLGSFIHCRTRVATRGIATASGHHQIRNVVETTDIGTWKRRQIVRSQFTPPCGPLRLAHHAQGAYLLSRAAWLCRHTATFRKTRAATSSAPTAGITSKRTLNSRPRFHRHTSVCPTVSGPQQPPRRGVARPTQARREIVSLGSFIQQLGVLHAIAGVPDSRCAAPAAAPRSAAANTSRERNRFIGLLCSAIGVPDVRLWRNESSRLVDLCRSYPSAPDR